MGKGIGVEVCQIGLGSAIARRDGGRDVRAG